MRDPQAQPSGNWWKGEEIVAWTILCERNYDMDQRVSTCCGVMNNYTNRDSSCTASKRLYCLILLTTRSLCHLETAIILVTDFRQLRFTLNFWMLNWTFWVDTDFGCWYRLQSFKVAVMLYEWNGLVWWVGLVKPMQKKLVRVTVCLRQHSLLMSAGCISVSLSFSVMGCNWILLSPGYLKRF